MSHDPNATVLTRRQGRIGRITLNRPKALNALDLPMIQAVAAALDTWRDEPGVHAVVIEGAGGRAFCAGGDIREIRALSLAGEHEAIATFFRAEYALNLAIARYPKPYIALIDGVCMGGGIGLSVHGSARVATEGATFAMPEVGIGFFPDVGGTYVLPRLRRGWGLLMGLTGARLSAAEAAWAGIATHLVSRDRVATLADEIAADGVAVLADAVVPAVRPTREDIVPAFATGDLPDIRAALATNGSEAARDALAALDAASPSAVAWTFEALRHGAGRTLEACLQMELALTRHATRHPDMLEGIRAMVVDKDRSPRWSPARPEDVDPAGITALFG